MADEAPDNLPAELPTEDSDALVQAGLSADPTTQLAEIQDLMAEGDHGPYWKGPHAPVLQERLRQLLEAAAAAPDALYDLERREQFSPDQVRQSYGAAMDGFDDQEIGFMQASAERLAGAPHWAIIASSFDGAQLTVAGRKAAFVQLARPVLSEEAHLEPEALTNKRIAALMAGLSEADQLSLDAWWQSLPEGAQLDLIEQMITPVGELTTWEAGA